MPMHDWTRVSAGTYHDFHNSWITHLKEALNAGLLPPAYYALGEQRSGDIGPDVVTLRTEDGEPEPSSVSSYDEGDRGGLIAVAETPPRVQILQETLEEITFYLQRRRTLVIRHASGDRMVALVEIVSPANKHTHRTLQVFVDKVFAAFKEGIHVLVIDPEPFRVGSMLVEMPLFLTPEHYSLVPLESTYMQAWAGVPHRWRRVIERES